MRYKMVTLGVILTAGMAGNTILHAAAMDAGISAAAPTRLNPAEVPVGTKWIIYWNFDRVREYPDAGKLQAKFIHSRPDIGIRIAILQKIMGVKFPHDFHDVLLMGKKIDPVHGVVVIHATASQEHIVQFLKSNPTTALTTESSGIIKIVDKKDKITYEASPAANTFVISQSETALTDELHVLSGQAVPMSPKNPLLAGVQDDLIMYAGNMDMSQLTGPRKAKHRGPVWLSKVTSAWLAGRVTKAKLDITGHIQTKSADTAAQMVQSAQGMQSMMELGATGANAKPKQRFMAGVIDRLDVGAVGRTIHIRWRMSLAKLLAGPQKQKPTAESQ